MERCVPEASWCDMIVCRVIMLVRRATISKFVVRMSIPKLRREHFPAGPPELSQHRLISIASSEGTLNCGALGPIRLLMAWKTATTTIKEECSKGCTSSNDSNVKLCLLLRHSLSVCRITKRNVTRQTKKKKETAHPTINCPLCSVVLGSKNMILSSILIMPSERPSPLYPPCTNNTIHNM